MTIGFRTIFHVDRTLNPLSVVQAQIRTWLVEKNYPADLVFEPAGITRRDSTSAFQCVENHEDSRKDWFGVLVEENTDKTWKVSIGVHDSGEQDSDIQVLIEVDVTPADLETAIELVETPRFAKRLLEQLSISDGEVPILAGVGEIRTEEQVETLIQMIEAPGRRITINVAPSPETSLDNEWLSIVSQLTSRGTGNSSVYLLDAELTKKFNSLVSNEFGVGPGTVRTYAPGVDFSDVSNAAMHRFVTPMKLAKSIFKKNEKWRVARPLQNAFNIASRLQYMQAEVPGPISLVRDKLVKKTEQNWLQERLPTKVIQHQYSQVQVETHQPTVVSASPEKSSDVVLEPTLWRRFTKFISRFTGIDSVTEESLTILETYVERQSADLGAIENLMYEADEEKVAATRVANELRKELNTHLAELSQTAHRIRYLESENKRLRSGQLDSKQGKSSGGFDFTTLRDMFFCEDIAEALQENGSSDYSALRELVVFTGDLKITKELDASAQRENYAGIIIDYLEVLYDYASAKKMSVKLPGGVDFYLKNPSVHGGRTTGPVNHSGESKSTQQEFGKLRIFPVPAEVDKSGVVAMWNHFKIAQSDSIAPRLHYFDDTPNTGKIYIGYIGKHLKNSQTN